MEVARGLGGSQIRPAEGLWEEPARRQASAVQLSSASSVKKYKTVKAVKCSAAEESPDQKHLILFILLGINIRASFCVLWHLISGHISWKHQGQGILIEVQLRSQGDLIVGELHDLLSRCVKSRWKCKQFHSKKFSLQDKVQILLKK